MDIFEYVNKYSIRGACTCGKCYDSTESPELEQPEGHTVNLTFFEVALQEDPDVEEFLELVKDYMPTEEISYINLAADMGQATALQMMAVGHLLAVWELKSPDTMMPFLDDKTKQMMAGNGMVTISPLE